MRKFDFAIFGLCFFIAVELATGCSDDSKNNPADAGSDADTDTDTGWDPRFDAFAGALQDDLAASTAYGVSAAIMEDGVVTFAQAFGSKDPDGQVPLTPETLMQIGSTTKQMTAVGLLRKVEAGVVSLDDNLEQTLPLLEFALDETWDDQLTLRHLLSHQGALFDYSPWTGSSDDEELADWSYGGYANTYWLMAPPGSFWNYSNPNFSFVGLVTEELDDRYWPDIMLQDIFVPLGMDRTFTRKAEVEADGDFALSYGLGIDDLYTGVHGPVEMEVMPDSAWSRPAGLVWTTPTQMMTWARFLMQGDTDVLSDELRAELATEHADILYPFGDSHYGYGLFVDRGFLTLDDTWYETPVWQHGGATTSFSSFFYILPEYDFAVAICASGYMVDFEPSVDVAITTLVDLPEPSAAPEYEFDPAVLDDHVGTYTDQYNIGDMIFTREGNTLFVEAPDLEEYGYDVDPELVAISSYVFVMYLDDTPYDLTFIPLVDGGISHYMRNRYFVTARVDPTARSTTRQRPTREDVERMLLRTRLDPMPQRRHLATRRTAR